MPSSASLSTPRISPLSSNRSSLHSVVSRVIGVTALGAAAIGATLGLFFASNARLKSANAENARATAVSAAAFDLRSRVGDLNDALGAVVANYNRDTIARWHAAENAWRGPAAQLQRQIGDDATEARGVRTLRTQIEQYISDYGEPLLAIAKISPSSARSQVAVGEGAIRRQQIINSTESIASRSAMAAGERSSNANRLAHQATIGGLIAVILTPVLLILLGLWIARLVAEPLRRTVDAASSVAAGDFDVRLDERRRDEFGALSRAFNAMTAALATSRAELIERADSLERSERHKSELISMVSHEVRTPLASVLGFTRLLLERDIPEEDRRRNLQIIDAEATRLASLVSDFLDARLIEEGQFALRRELFDLRGLVREQAQVALEHDDTHELDLQVQDGPLRVQADRSRLAQVVGNILSNAVKYSPAGGTITVGAAAEDGSARVWVDDEGTGIAPEHREQIFEPFYRGGAPAAGIPGTGLGLAVSRRIVEAHNGRIGFDVLATGTRFWIDLPLETATLEVPNPTTAAA
jgi:signal transduction histidine kinase